MKITTGGTGVISSQSSMTAANLGAGGLVNPSFQYSWAINCAIAAPFSPGFTITSPVSTPYLNPINVSFTATQVSGDNGGWKFTPSGTTGGFFRTGWGGYSGNEGSSPLGTLAAWTDGVTTATPRDTDVSSTNKYLTYDMTIADWAGTESQAQNFAAGVSWGGTSTALTIWVPYLRGTDSSGNVVEMAAAFDGGANERPPSHINGTQISTSAGTVLPEFSGIRGTTTGLLLDGSEIINGTRLSITWEHGICQEKQATI